MLKQLLIIAVIFLVIDKVPVRAQTSILSGPHAYLDQPLPGDTPRRFLPPHLTDTGYFVLGRVAFSPDGTEFYYGANNAWYSNEHQILSYYRFENGSWTGPRLLLERYSAPTFSTDGRTLYVTNNKGIQQMQRTDTGWAAPSPYLNRSYALYNFMPTLSGRSYVGSNGTWGPRNDYSSWKFSVLPADLADTSIRSLGEPLNAPGFNGDFYIAPDESYIIISAQETKSFECELWISFRKKDNTWTTPQSLGPAVNEGLAHRFGQYVTPDGKFLFYTKGTSEKDCALYWVRFDKLLTRLRRAARQ